MYKFSLIAGIVLIMLGAFYKVQHHSGASEFLLTGMLISLIYMVIGLGDVAGDEKKSVLSKILWLGGFIFFTGVAGIIYYFTDIRKHLRENKDEE